LKPEAEHWTLDIEHWTLNIEDCFPPTPPAATGKHFFQSAIRIPQSEKVHPATGNQSFIPQSEFRIPHSKGLTPYSLHPAFCTLHPRLQPASIFFNPQSAIRNPQSAIRIPHSAFRNMKALPPASRRLK